jgi:6,7-dimethyl-8-ribityllumazine synthase
VSEPYDRTAGGRDASPDSIEEARENVLDGWPSSEDVSRFIDERRSERASAESAYAGAAAEPVGMTSAPDEPSVAESSAAGRDPSEPVASEIDPEPEPDALVEEPVLAPLVDPDPVHSASEHAPGELEIPPGYSVLEGATDGARRAVGVVVSRFNGEVTSRLLASALEQLRAAGVADDAITVMPVPGAFELPIGAMALAKTRRYACIVALGCVIRGDTPHFDYVAAEAASGLQLAGLETGVPVSFGVLTLERADQADARVDKGAEAVRTALEMADLFAHLRAAAAR